jgi:hypothetical protein
VSALVLYPYSDNSGFTGYALARAWHVWFSAFGPVQSGKAEISSFAPGVPTKVVIHTDPDLNQPVVLTGIDCSSGAALHFCYNQPDNCGLTGKSFTSDELARQGADHLDISRKASLDYTGYMLFPHPDRYLLSVRSGAAELGSATLGIGQGG